MKRLLPAMFFVLLVPGLALAHGLEAECRIEGGRATIKAFFDDQKPASAALVQVIDAKRKVVVEGRADDDGNFTFAMPPAGTYRVVVDDGTGHRLEFALKNTGPILEKYDHYPWFKVGIGLGSIAVFALAFWISRRAARGTASGRGGRS